jgi:predicted nucleotidyltransferase
MNEAAPTYSGPSPWPRLYKDDMMYTPPPETFLLSYRGSISHGTFLPAGEGIDDIDLMGFVFGPREHYLGLSDWGSRGTKEIKEGAYDVVLYEIKKAFRLLLEGNPNILSMLWTKPQHVLVETPAARELIANRDIFVGKHIYNAFAGYASAQAKKMESRDPAELREYLAVTAELKYRGKHPNHKGERLPEGKRETGEAVDCMAWSTDKLLARLAHSQKKGENLGYMERKGNSSYWSTPLTARTPHTSSACFGCRLNFSSPASFRFIGLTLRS